MKNRILLSIGLICSFMGMNIQEGMGQIDSFNGSGCGAATTSGTCTVAIGEDADADGNRTTAIGYGAIANGEGGVAIGLDAQVGLVSTSNMGFAFGFLAEALAHESFTFGSTLQATAVQSMVIGIGTTPYLVNNIPQSLMIGMNSDVPSFFIGDGNNAYSNIGIATTDPLARMHINGTLRLGENGSGTNGSLVFENTATTNTFTINSGPTAVAALNWTLPATQGANLEVLTNDGFGGLSWAVPNTSTTAWQLLGNSGTNPTTPDFNFLGTIDNVDLAIRTYDTERMRVMAAGNVGIGTSTPDGLLHLNATNTYMIVEKGIDNEGGVVWHNGPQSAGTANASLMFETDETLRLRNAMINENVVINVNDGGTDREAIFVEGTSAHVGIGTSNPVTRLHVVALAATVIPDDETIARFAVSDNDTAFIQLENIDDTNGHFAGGIRSISSTADNSALLIAAAVHPTIDTGSEPMMIFSPRRLGSTNITTRPLFEWANNTNSKMLMDAGGNLGIGITTSTPQGKLEVNGTVFVNYGSVPASTIPGGGIGEEDLGINASGQLINLSTSSIHFKDNVENIEFDKEAFLNLRPVTYNWKEFYGGYSDVGLIAQEVAEIFPPLASWAHQYTHLDNGDLLRDSTGIPVVDTTQLEVSGVRYHKLPVYLLSIVKDQQQTIRYMQEQLESLTTLVDNCCNRADGAMNRISEEPDTEGVVATPVEAKAMDMPVLSQNAPNPFNETAVIRFYLPKNTKGASIKIFDATGTVFRLFTLNGFGSGSITVEANTLAPGNYHYSLLMDGYVVDTKTMLVTY